MRAHADYEVTLLFVSHDRHVLAELSNRALDVTPEGGGDTEYVERADYEAPGAKS